MWWAAREAKFSKKKVSGFFALVFNLLTSIKGLALGV
jgi:hypothetical protein